VVGERQFDHLMIGQRYSSPKRSISILRQPWPPDFRRRDRCAISVLLVNANEMRSQLRNLTASKNQRHLPVRPRTIR
jgi:hypothetical protein